MADENRTSRVGQAGIAMHAECMGLAVAWVLFHCGSDVASIMKSNACARLLTSRSDSNLDGVSDGAAEFGRSSNAPNCLTAAEEKVSQLHCLIDNHLSQICEPPPVTTNAPYSDCVFCYCIGGTLEPKS